MVLPFLKAQSKNFRTSADWALSAGSAYIRMKGRRAHGPAVGPLAFTIEIPMPGTLNQSALAAAATKVASSGDTYRAIGVLQLQERHVVLLDVGVLHVAHRTLDGVIRPQRLRCPYRPRKTEQATSPQRPCPPYQPTPC